MENNLGDRMSDLTRKFRLKLLDKQDTKYRDFHKGLCTTSKYKIIGVRAPDVKNIAKEFEQSDIEDYIYDDDIEYYEEILLRGFLIGNKKNNLENTFRYLKYFIPMIDNWAVCDGTCAGLKITNKNLDEMWNFLQDYIVSNKEFEIRFVLVMYLDYYTKTKYLKKIFKQIEKIKCEEYYVKMAIAWLIAEAFIHNREDTLEYIKKSKLDKWTYNKAIQKIRESYRASNEDKELLNKMKK